MAEKSVEGYIKALLAGQRKIAESLRRLALEAAPKAQESSGPSRCMRTMETSGSKMAHIKLTSADQINTRLLRGFVRDAVELNRAKGDPTKTR